MIHIQFPPSPAVKTIKVISEAFENEEYIPKKYTCEGLNVSPPISLSNIPEETKSIAVIVDDPDAPIRPWTHWLIWNVTPVKQIREGSAQGKQGMNDFRLNKYSGPCPPSGTHRYFFKVYALDTLLNIPVTTNKHDLEHAMQSHIIGYGELIGLYKSTS